MPQQQQSSKSSTSKKILNGMSWIKIIVYFIIFYVIYSIIVSIIRFASPIFKTLKDFFGVGDASNPGITGAPWWAWFGMAWYLLPAGALGAGASELYKKFKFHNPDKTKAEIADITKYTESDVKADFANNPDMTPRELSANKMRDATQKLYDYTIQKAESFEAAAAAAAEGSAEQAEYTKKAEEARSEAEDLKKTGEEEANKIEGK
jgi:hypothetical protein